MGLSEGGNRKGVGLFYEGGWRFCLIYVGIISRGSVRVLVWAAAAGRVGVRCGFGLGKLEVADGDELCVWFTGGVSKGLVFSGLGFLVGLVFLSFYRQWDT